MLNFFLNSTKHLLNTPANSSWVDLQCSLFPSHLCWQCLVPVEKLGYLLKNFPEEVLDLTWLGSHLQTNQGLRDEDVMV